MSAIISNGSEGDTGSHVATGVTEVIASGQFGGGTVEVLVSADGQAYAPAYTFMSPGAVSLQSAAGTTVQATVIGGPSAVIDVTCN